MNRRSNSPGPRPELLVAERVSLRRGLQRTGLLDSLNPGDQTFSCHFHNPIPFKLNVPPDAGNTSPVLPYDILLRLRPSTPCYFLRYADSAPGLATDDKRAGVQPKGEQLGAKQTSLASHNIG